MGSGGGSYLPEPQNVTFDGNRNFKEVAGNNGIIKGGGYHPPMTVAFGPTEMKTQRLAERRQEGGGHRGVNAQERESRLQALEGVLGSK